MAIGKYDEVEIYPGFLCGKFDRLKLRLAAG